MGLLTLDLIAPIAFVIGIIVSGLLSLVLKKRPTLHVLLLGIQLVIFGSFLLIFWKYVTIDSQNVDTIFDYVFALALSFSLSGLFLSMITVFRKK